MFESKEIKNTSNSNGFQVLASTQFWILEVFSLFSMKNRSIKFSILQSIEILEQNSIKSIISTYYLVLGKGREKSKPWVTKVLYPSVILFKTFAEQSIISKAKHWVLCYSFHLYNKVLYEDWVWNWSLVKSFEVIEVIEMSYVLYPLVLFVNKLNVYFHKYLV
jgi:hypothetical protein